MATFLPRGTVFRKGNWPRHILDATFWEAPGSETSPKTHSKLKDWKIIEGWRAKGWATVSYIFPGLELSDGVEDHVQAAREHATVLRLSSHGVGLSRRCDAIREEEAWEDGNASDQT